MNIPEQTVDIHIAYDGKEKHFSRFFLNADDVENIAKLEFNFYSTATGSLFLDDVQFTHTPVIKN